MKAVDNDQPVESILTLKPLLSKFTPTDSF